MFWTMRVGAMDSPKGHAPCARVPLENAMHAVCTVTVTGVGCGVRTRAAERYRPWRRAPTAGDHARERRRRGPRRAARLAMGQAAPAIRPLVEEAAAAAGVEASAERVTLAPPAGDRGMVAGAQRANGGCCPTPIDESKPDEEGVSCQP
ncbi:MAG: hypothetical protein ACRERE_06070 [Candidatus Entotheonellia bacterium]